MKLLNIFKSKKLKVGSEFKYRNTNMICKVTEITKMKNTTITIYNYEFIDDETVNALNNMCRRNGDFFAKGTVAYFSAIENLIN